MHITLARCLQWPGLELKDTYCFVITKIFIIFDITMSDGRNIQILHEVASWTVKDTLLQKMWICNQELKVKCLLSWISSASVYIHHTLMHSMIRDMLSCNVVCWKLVLWSRHVCNAVTRPSHWWYIVQKQVIKGRSGWDRDTIHPMTRRCTINMILTLFKHVT